MRRVDRRQEKHMHGSGVSLIDMRLPIMGKIMMDPPHPQNLATVVDMKTLY
jgi:hypothetical protein